MEKVHKNNQDIKSLEGPLLPAKIRSQDEFENDKKLQS